MPGSNEVTAKPIDASLFSAFRRRGIASFTSVNCGGWKPYKRGSHTVWDCKYHLVWVTKYRYPVLGGDVGERCRELAA